MASSSSSSIRRYHVFPSFHGPDVRKKFLSHLLYHLETKGITAFKDTKIERGHTIGPELVQAIRESRLSIALLSKNYASSSWCLDELVEILKCKEDQRQIVMTMFYDVDPSDVRKQIRDFGSAFEKTCEGKTEEVKQRWIKALTDVAKIAGEHSLHWANEAAMLQKFASDVSNKLNVTPSSDFEGIVGLEAHLKKLHSLIRVECDKVKMIGIWGPAGIGKTTIARAFFSQLSADFPLNCFMGNLKGSYKSIMGVDDSDSKLCLQRQLLSKIWNQRDMTVQDLGAIKRSLADQSVLIILDDVDDLEKLEVLAKETSWFGPGSRIIVTTEDKKILKAHRIQGIYHMDFPSKEEALEILCLSAFNKSSVGDGFEELASKVAKLCGNLPLGLRVVGSSLRGEEKPEWERQLSRIETSLDRKIEDVLRVGYDRLSKKDQSIFLHIACFFFFPTDADYLTTMLAPSNLDVGNGLKILADKSLMQIDTDGRIVMHYLLQQLGRQIVREQSDEAGKRQFLIEVEDICDVLASETGTGSVTGISFDMSKIDEFSISKRAFKKMPNLRFLEILHGEDKLKIPEDMKYLPRLRLLHWDSYPIKCLPPRFQPECLVEVDMPHSKLEKLWEGIQPLTNLKKIDLRCSFYLKEIPNLSNATNLEGLNLFCCSSLVELPSSIRNLHKLKLLDMFCCENLRVIPTNINLASLEEVDMTECLQLRTFPDISSSIKTLNVRDTKIEDVSASIVGRWSRLERLYIGSRSLERLTHVPLSVKKLDLSNSDINTIPDCVKDLPHLVDLIVVNCPNLVSIPALPPSLESLYANRCASLKRVCCSFRNPIKVLTFRNCLQLDEESRRGIIQQSVSNYICLPGKEVPAEFTHRATWNSVSLPLAPGGEGTFSASSRVKACVLLSKITSRICIDICCFLRSKEGVEIDRIGSVARKYYTYLRSEHLLVFPCDLFHQRNRCHEVDVATSEIVFKIRSRGIGLNKIEFGVQILAEDADSSNSSEVDNFETGGNRNHHTDGDEKKSKKKHKDKRVDSEPEDDGNESKKKIKDTKVDSEAEEIYADSKSNGYGKKKKESGGDEIGNCESSKVCEGNEGNQRYPNRKTEKRKRDDKEVEKKRKKKKPSVDSEAEETSLSSTKDTNKKSKEKKPSADSEAAENNKDSSKEGKKKRKKKKKKQSEVSVAEETRLNSTKEKQKEDSMVEENNKDSTKDAKKKRKKKQKCSKSDKD